MMLVHKTLLFLGLLAAGANAAPTGNTHHLEAREQPSTLWRADSRDPEEIKKEGGFHARDPEKQHEYGLWKHVRAELKDVESGYVSTSSSKPFAESWSRRTLQGGGGYIYEIAPSSNMVDVTTIIGEFLKETIWENQHEFAAVGSIQFAQIKGWQKFTFTGYDEATDKPTGTFGPYEKNSAFDGANYPKKIAPDDYAIAGFPEGHAAWKKEPWKSFAPTCEGKSTIHKRETTTRRTPKKAASTGKKSPGKRAGSKASGKKLATGKGKPKGKPAATTCKKPETAKEAYMKILKKAGGKGSDKGAIPKKTIGSKKTTGKKASTGMKSKTHPR
jgi:cholera enterotoxin subunit A